MEAFISVASKILMNSSTSFQNEPLAPVVSVLRLGHRLVRDERTSTHLGLAARALGAIELFIAGRDDETVQSLNRISKKWGGDFAVSYTENWRELLKSWKKRIMEEEGREGRTVHLTMYGEGIDAILPKIWGDSKLSPVHLLLIVGAEKVPRDVYEMADYNISIGNQPHSEIAALAIFLDRIYRGKELYNTYPGARLKVVPSSRRKDVVNIST